MIRAAAFLGIEVNTVEIRPYFLAGIFVSAASVSMAQQTEPQKTVNKTESWRDRATLTGDWAGVRT